MINFKWKGFDWYAYEHCKNDTPNCKNAYLGENVTLTDNNTLVFPISYCPKSFDNDTLNTERKYKCAFIESSTKFTYGRFIFSAVVGNSPSTWPALWLYGAESWPPEIDALEAFPDKNGNIINCLTTKWESNIHYDDNGPKQYGAKGISSLLYILTHRNGKPDKWEIDWTKTHIKIYFNGIRVRKITDKKIIDHFNKHPFMRVVINNMIQEEFSYNEYEKQRPFELIEFNYLPY